MLKQSLHSVIIAAILAVPVVSLNTPAALADRRNFKVNNQTNTVMVNLQVSPMKTNSWEEDVLGQKTLGAGESIVVNFVDNIETCLYDMRVKFEGREPIELYGLDVCKTENYNFHD